jgi:hypothetical protein
MPKELARVVAHFDDIKGRVSPLMRELADHEREYILMSGNLFAAREALVERLRALKVQTAADPAAAKDAEIAHILKINNKFELLKSDRHAAYVTTAKKLHTVRAEVAQLEKEVAAVTKAKSGFFSTSKSLPKLSALSKSLKKFTDELQAAISADL